MKINGLLGKLHKATVTEANIDYDGSITIDPGLMDKVGIMPYQQVEVYDISNGNRFTTYAIQGEKRGEICVNGAAARLVEVGDRLIIVAYAEFSREELANHNPRVVLLNQNNQIT